MTSVVRAPMNSNVQPSPMMDASASAGPSTQTGGYYMNDGNSQSGSDANGALARYFDTSGGHIESI